MRQTAHVHGPPGEVPALRIRSSGYTRWLFLTYAAGFTALLVLLVVLFSRPDATNAGWGIAGAILVAIGAVFTGVAAVAAFRPVRITGGELRLARMWSTVRIPVSDIAGVGLLFVDGAPGTRVVCGWSPYVWRTDRTVVALGTGRFVPRRVVRAGDPSATKRVVVGKNGIDALASTDMAALAGSAAGTAATRVRSFVLASQGPAGPLARQELQREPTRPADAGALFTAYWSPTGESGRY